EIRKANNKFKFLQETEIAPTTLRYIRKEKVVVEMEDQYYREDAGRFRSFLSALFTWLLQLGIVVLTLADIVQINLKRDQESEAGDDLNSLDNEAWRETNTKYIENSTSTCILRVLFFQPVVIFGCSFFKSD
ncbi:hypothetical protein TrLO_g6607, partial [Triparma laevis f. longispina]